MESLKEANRITVEKLMAKAKQTADENTNTRAEVEATTKASKEETARLHKSISQYRKMVEEQKKMISRLTARLSAGGGASGVSVASAAETTSPATNPKKRTADDAQIPAQSSAAASAGSAEKKARSVAAANPSAAAPQKSPAGGDAPNPMLAFLTRKEKAGTLTPQQKEQLAKVRYASDDSAFIARISNRIGAVSTNWCFLCISVARLNSRSPVRTCLCTAAVVADVR